MAFKSFLISDAAWKIEEGISQVALTTDLVLMARICGTHANCSVEDEIAIMRSAACLASQIGRCVLQETLISAFGLKHPHPDKFLASQVRKLRQVLETLSSPRDSYGQHILCTLHRLLQTILLVFEKPIDEVADKVKATLDEFISDGLFSLEFRKSTKTLRYYIGRPGGKASGPCLGDEMNNLRTLVQTMVF
jgi:hypothetical protein